MRKLVSFLLVACILLGISLPAEADEISMNIIELRDEDGIKLSMTLDADETHYSWNLHYENNQEEIVLASLRVNNPEKNLKFEENENWIEQSDNWLSVSSNEVREGTLNLITTKDVTSLSIELMLDNDVTKIIKYLINDEQFFEEVENELNNNQDELINDIIQTENETIVIIDDITKLEEVTEEILDISRGINKPYTDPFKYTEDVSGKYPTNGSNSFIGGNGSTSNTTMNFNYGKHNPVATPETTNAYGETLDFLSGYHYYPNIDDQGKPKDGIGLLSKKTVKPTDDPNKFDLEVDIIGGATPIKNQVDVMLIIDKSASMNSKPDGNPATIFSKSRWDLLKVAVGNLATNLLTKDNDIQIGMTSFGSEWKNNSTTNIWTEVANFNTGDTPAYFTKDPTVVKGNSILSGAKTPDGSGTPTFLGIQSGMEITQTAGRANALKFVILVTDGVSTFGPGTNFNSLSNRTNLVKSSKKNGVDTYQFKNDTENLYTGTGFETGSLNPPLSTITSKTLDHFKTLKNNILYKDYKYMSLGFTTIKESKPPKTEEPATQMNILLNEFQNAGRFNAIDQKELNKAFEEIKRKIYGYDGIFTLGELIDPMSEQVTLIEDSLKTSALTLKYDDITKNYSGITAVPKHTIDGQVNEDFPDYANDIIINKPSTEDQSIIHLSDMNLGSSGNDRMGFRINYTVELKEGYRDGRFYQTNGPTRAVAFNFTNPIGFAVPSILVPFRNLDLKKVGEDGNSLPGAKFGINIKGEQETIQTKVSDALGNVSFTGLKAGTYELKELEAPQGYQLLTEPIEFKIVHGSPPYKGEMDVTIDDEYKVNGNIVIKNQMKPYHLSVTKVDAYNEPLNGASFNLKSQNESYDKTIDGSNFSKFDFTELKWGSYTLTETKSPPGYVIMKPVVIVINKDGTVTIDDSPSNSIDNIIEFMAVNHQKGMLPSTGSTQMILYTAIPIGLMVLASAVGLYGVYRRRRYRL